MLDTTITHGVSESLYRKLVEEAEKAGLTPDEYAARIVRERLIELTKPRGAGKVRFLRKD